MRTRWIWGTALCVVLALLPSICGAQYSGGNGDPNTPYLISTANDMQTIGVDPNDWDKYFELTSDIDLSGFDGLEPNPAYNIIGTDPNRFVGQFDGGGFTISNLTINATGTNIIGLFGYVGGGGVIKNFILLNPTINSDSDTAGSLVGIIKGGEILSCQAKGCDVSGTIIIGGLIGNSFNANIDSCGVTGLVSGTSIVGGLIGQDNLAGASSTISNCFANTTLTNTGDDSGGLMGISQYSTVANCYSKGSVTGNERVGGLIGRMDLFANIISKCYSACSVSGNGIVGGLIGDPNGSGSGNVIPVIENSFWDTTLSGQSQMCHGANGGCDDSAGRSMVEMKQQMTFSDYGWDFVGEATNGVEDIWRICEGTNYPKLAWEKIQPGDWACPDGVGLEDLKVLSEQWMLENLSGDVAPGGGDGRVNFLDWSALMGANPVSVADFSRQWLVEGASEDDIAPNGGDEFFNLFDFSEMSRYWMMGQ